MRWWLRLILTLLLGPIVWWLAMGYLVTQQGATLPQWFESGRKVLPDVYLIYTFPALVLAIVMAQAERLLKAAGLTLMTVLVSPVVAFVVSFLVTRYVPEAHVRAAATSVPLFVAYGLVWGLTIREPRPRRSKVDTSNRGDEWFVAALLP